jgi:myo-inositol 2-dehydrogenase / D-chiro-inositol 1-dehydrogenase
LDNVRVGLVGYGRFGKLHAEAIRATPGLELRSICVGRKESVDESRKDSGAEVFWDFDEFLAKGKLDAVDIVSPNYLHAKHARAALARGLHVFLEKPIATELRNAKELMDRAAASNSVVQVGLQYRYEPFWREFKRAMDSGLILSPKFAKIESWRGPFRPGSGDWRYDGARVGHQLLEEAIHYFDLAVWLFGMPSRVSGFTDSPETWKKGLFGTAVVVLEYPSGIKLMLVDTLNGVMGHTTASVTGNGAMLGVMQAGMDGSTACWVRIRDAQGGFSGSTPRALPEVEGVKLELLDFVKTIKTGSKPPVTLKDGFNALRVDLAAISAVGSGSVVDLGGKDN